MILTYDSYPPYNVDNFNYQVTKEEFQTNPFLKILLYKENDEIKGFLIYSKIYDRIEINQIEVLAKYQQHHIGSNLLEYLITKAIEANIKNITLEVKKTNLKAINLYKKYHFHEEAVRPNYYNGTDGLLMILNL